MAPAITPAQLVQELMSRYEATSQDDLSHKLREVGIRVSSRTITRWAGNGGMSFANAVLLLDLAGYLNKEKGEQSSASAAPSDPLERIAAGIAVLARNQVLALDALNVPESDRAQLQQPSGQTRARPKPPRRKRVAR